MRLPRAALLATLALAVPLVPAQAAPDSPPGPRDLTTSDVDAFSTDVRPVLADLREEQGLPRDPMAAFLASGYLETIAAERVGGNQAGWGA